MNIENRTVQKVLIKFENGTPNFFLSLFEWKYRVLLDTVENTVFLFQKTQRL